MLPYGDGRFYCPSIYFMKRPDPGEIGLGLAVRRSLSMVVMFDPECVSRGKKCKCGIGMWDIWRDRIKISY